MKKFWLFAILFATSTGATTLAQPLVPLSSAPQTKFEEKREAITKALYILRFTPAFGYDEEKRKTTRRLAELGLDPTVVWGLETALGGNYALPIPEFPILSRPIDFTTAEYDKNVQKAAKALGVGSDYKEYLRQTSPELLYGRLKATDATDPKFLNENVSVVKGLVRENVWPDDGVSLEDRMPRALDKMSPHLWKNSEWRDFVRKHLTHGSLKELSNLQLLLSPERRDMRNRGAGKFRTLFWGLDDVFRDAKVATADDPLRFGALVSLENAFPEGGTAGFAKRVLRGRQNAIDTLKLIEDVDSAALDGFYEELGKQLRTQSQGQLKPGVAYAIVEAIRIRGDAELLSKRDLELLRDALPSAMRDSLIGEDVDVNHVLDKIEKILDRRPLAPKWKERSELLGVFRAVRKNASASASSEATVLNLLRSTDPEEVYQGLTAVERSGVGHRSPEIQRELGRIAKDERLPSAELKPKGIPKKTLEMTDPKDRQRWGTELFRRQLRDTVNAVVKNGELVDGLLMHEVSTNEWVYNQASQSFQASGLPFEPALYEHLLTEVSFDKDRARELVMRRAVLLGQIPADSPVSAVGLHLIQGDEIAEKYVLALLNSSDPDTITRGLRLSARTPVAEKSIAVQQRIIQLFPKLGDLPNLFLHSHGGTVEQVIEQVLDRIARTKQGTIDAGLPKLLLSLPKGKARDAALRGLNFDKVSYDEALEQLSRNYDVKMAEGQKRLVEGERGWNFKLNTDDYILSKINRSMTKKAPVLEMPIQKTTAIVTDSCARGFAAIMAKLRRKK